MKLMTFLQKVSFSKFIRNSLRLFSSLRLKKIVIELASLILTYRTTLNYSHIFLILLSFFVVQNCTVGSDDEFQKNQDALNAAFLLKKNECGNSPPFPIYKIGKKDPPAFGTNACTVAILFQPCPFKKYPLICLEYYNFDVPNIGPDLLK